MAYALIIDDQVSQYPYTLAQFRADNPTVSLPETPTEEQLNEVGMYTVQPTQQPAYDPITQNCTQGTPEMKWGQWYQTWVITPASPEEVAVREEAARQANKDEASALLSATDWTTIPDVGNPEVSNPYLINVQDFVNYRNAVRQIAVYPPVTVSAWPQIPVEQWGS